MDFDSLCLLPAMEAFAEPIIVDPLMSQPGVLPYAARAIFSSRPFEVQLDDSVIADQRTEIGYRLSEFVVPPTSRDLISIRGVQYIGVSAHVDGQGGGSLLLRRTKPAGSTALPSAAYAWPVRVQLNGSSTMASV